MSLARFAMSLAAKVRVVAFASVTLLAGCGGKSIGDDLTGPNNPNNPSYPPTPIDPNPPACSTIAPACDPGDRSVGSEAGCADADYCYSRTQECNGSTVWCAHDEVVQCEAIPACDKGDRPVSVCPKTSPGITCYPRTLCGSTIQCVHADACKALPQCEVGDIEVTAINTCSQPGVSCYAVTACNFTIHCYTP